MAMALGLDNSFFIAAPFITDSGRDTHPMRTYHTLVAHARCVVGYQATILCSIAFFKRFYESI